MRQNIVDLGKIVVEKCLKWENLSKKLTDPWKWAQGQMTQSSLASTHKDLTIVDKQWFVHFFHNKNQALFNDFQAKFSGFSRTKDVLIIKLGGLDVRTRTFLVTGCQIGIVLIGMGNLALQQPTNGSFWRIVASCFKHAECETSLAGGLPAGRKFKWNTLNELLQWVFNMLRTWHFLNTGRL